MEHDCVFGTLPFRGKYDQRPAEPPIEPTSDGLRMSKTVGSKTTAFAWNLPGSLPNPLQERVSGGAVTDYIYGSNGTPLEQISGSSVLLL